MKGKTRRDLVHKKHMLASPSSLPPPAFWKVSVSVLAQAFAALHCHPLAVTPRSMARLGQLALCASTAVSAADVPQLRGRQLQSCNEISSSGYTGYNNKDNGPSDGQWNDPVYGSNDDWWKCAQKCNDNGGCAGWTFVYDGSGTNQRQCWLKPTLVSTDCNSWASSGDVISGLGRAEPQLQGQQVEAGNSTSDNLQSANTYCSDPLDVQGPHAASCQWMKTDGDDCQNSDDDACRCRDYNTVQQRCTGCSVNPCQKRFCFDIIDLPDNNCQWMYNEGDDCTSTDDKAEACRQANAHSCAPCPR